MPRKSKKRTKGSQPSYLDPLDSVGYLSRLNFRAFSTELEKLTSLHGVSAGQWRFLRVLWEADDITQRELSDRVVIKEATTVRAIDGLVKAGLVVRHRNQKDRRKINIKLTRKARMLERRLLPMVSEVNERALRGLSRADIDTTRRVLIHTYRNLIADDEETR
ncbi:MAG: MarR family winged helix-turn-helix transcriptional regulator [Anaerolineales bacterium]